jgi:hypothetical protein
MLPAGSWDAPDLLRSQLLCRSLQQRRRSSRTQGKNIVTLQPPDKPSLGPESPYRRCDPAEVDPTAAKASVEGASMHQLHSSFLTNANVALHPPLDVHRAYAQEGITDDIY